MEINYDEIEMAMSADPTWGDGFYLDTLSGAVIAMDDWSQTQAEKYASLGEIPDETHEAIRAVWCLLYEREKVGETADEATHEAAWAYLERLIRIPTFETHDEYGDMERFASQVSNPSAAEQLQSALGGRGSFRRFKDTLNHFPTMREAWFTFQDEQRRRRIDEWLRDEGLLPEADEEEWEEEQANVVEEEAAATTHLLNCGAPLAQREEARLRRQVPGRLAIYHIGSLPDDGQTAAEKVAERVAEIELSPAAWQTETIWLLLPPDSLVAALLVVEVHGRMGYFPELVQRQDGGIEIVSLQEMWEAAREHRY